MKFLVQVDDYGIPVTEDGWMLMNNRDNSMMPERLEVYPGTMHSYPKGAEDACPVGTVEFVHKYLGKPQEPFNHQGVLGHLVHRKFFRGTWNELQQSTSPVKDLETVFVKDISQVKPARGPSCEKVDKLKHVCQLNRKYEFSEIIETDFEWRIWVLDGRVVDIRPYLIPDIHARDNVYRASAVPYAEMLQPAASALGETFPNLPVSFDMGFVTWCGGEKVARWELIEVHHCYSLGLYGFDDPWRLAVMLWRTFNYLKGLK